MLQKWVEPALRFYFKNVCVQNLEGVTKNHPVIYVANHQNAFIDAILIAVITDTQPASLVRADVFKTPLARKLLGLIKMMPVYRIRDGYRTPVKNEKVFAKAREYLSKNGSLIIFPEGNHGALKKLRSLKHGASRLAAQTVCNTGVEEVVIQPVGLEYSSHSKFRSNAAVVFGIPIKVNRQKFAHGENDPKQLRTLTQKMGIELKSLIYHQDAPKNNRLIYDFISTLYPENVQDKGLFLLNFNKAKAAAMKFNFHAITQDMVEEMEEVLKNTTTTGFPGAHYSPFRDVKKPLLMSCLLLLPSLPAIAAYFLPYWFLKLLQYRITDVQFRTSIKFSVGMIVFPSWNLLLFAGFYLLSGYFIASLLGVIFLTLSGRFFILLRDSVTELKRTFKFYRRGNRELYAQILHRMESLIPG